MDQSKDAVARFFDADSSDYLEHKYDAGASSYMFLRRDEARDLIARHLAPQFGEQFTFLDSGCGPGILQQVLNGFPLKYTGIDISLEMLKLAGQHPIDARSGFRRQLMQSDVERVPFPTDSFDAAASLGVIEYLENDERILTEMSRIIRPGGYLLIAVTNRSSYNLVLEKPLNWLRSRRLPAAILNRIKLGLGLGPFKQMAFHKRRHRPAEFVRALERHGFSAIEDRTWGFNALPHPLHYLCGNRLNGLSNAAYSRARSRWIRKLGEGYLVLCRNDKGAPQAGNPS